MPARLVSDLSTDHAAICERLRGTITDVRILHDEAILLVYADGREVTLRPQGWDAEAISVE